MSLSGSITLFVLIAVLIGSARIFLKGSKRPPVARYNQHRSEIPRSDPTSGFRDPFR